MKRKISNFGVVVYKKKTYTVNYKVINDPDTDGAGQDTGVTTTSPSSVTASSLQTGLNDIYKQSVVSWTVTDSGTQNVEFDVVGWKDTDGDNIADINNGPDDGFEGYVKDEANIIIVQAGDASYDRNIFFVDNLSDGTTGWNPNSDKYIFIHFSSGASIQTIGHELGHSLKLRHTNTPASIFNIAINDLSNLILTYHELTARKLLKKQWDRSNNDNSPSSLASSNTKQIIK